MNLNGKTVILTGAGGALAGAIGKTLLEAGAELILVGHGAGRARARLGAGRALEADLSTPQGAQSLSGQIEGASSLVHTVGAFAMQAVRDATPPDLEHMMSANFSSLVYTVQACLPELERQNGGAIVGIAAGQVPGKSGAGAALYTASKAALSGFLNALDGELPSGLRSSVLFPMGTLDTPANRTAMPDADSRRWIALEDLAEAVLFLLTRGSRGRVRELEVHPAREG